MSTARKLDADILSQKTAPPPLTAVGEKKQERSLVILASSIGTVFEWYDFYLYGTLAVFFGSLFFPKGNDTAAFLASLATFGAGFAVRPFGALFFGRLGDMIGRKHTFLVTILVMGGSTALVGLLPTYEQIGIFAPILLVSLRLAQGLALGGEYGGAATYVAEHAPDAHRGRDTSWIQTTATLGFFLSLAVILGCRLAVGEEVFKIWGWRIPFLVSVILLGVSVYIRLKLKESPVFTELKAKGKTSKSPLKESFTNPKNLKYVLLSLFGLTAGQGVVWYTGQFYALFFLQNTLKVDFQTAYILIAVSLALGTPFFIFFGSLSDMIGRKRIMMAGCLLAALTSISLFKQLTHYANPALETASQTSPVVLHYAQCGEGCRSAKEFLAKKGVPYTSNASREFLGGTLSSSVPFAATVGATTFEGFDNQKLTSALNTAGYPEKADPKRINSVMVVAVLFTLMIYVTMVYGPIAAYLVELFPTKIRYTSMSLPYHLGNGWFGGFLPLIASAVVVETGDIYAGLYYPMAVALMSFVIGGLFLHETKDVKLQDES